jgi:hypothetical protein
MSELHPSTKRKIERLVTLGISKGEVKSEDDARKIAQAVLKGKGLPSYEETLAISDVLPKTVKTVISKTSFRHPWFQRKVTRLVFEDIWGRVWNQTTGIVKKSVKLVRLPKRYKSKIWIDELGGMSWTSGDGIHFECDFRTSREEFMRKNASPETFIG